MQILTIGHSNHRWESFLVLLKQHGVQVLVDVRTNPASRRAPFVNKRKLEGLLEGEGIRYVYIGDSLGGKPADPDCYDADGNPDYTRMGAKPEFQQGIQALLQLAEHTRVAVMCAEEDPAKCHRTLLLGPALAHRGVGLAHIRKAGVGASGGTGQPVETARLTLC